MNGPGGGRLGEGPAPAPGHTCRVTFAEGMGLLVGSPVDERWCLSHQRDNVLLASDAKDDRLRL